MKINLLLALLGASALCACATQKDVKQVETKIDVLQKQSTVTDNISTELATAKSDIDEIRDIQKRTEAAFNVALKNQADTKADHDALIGKVNSLSAGLDENAHYLKSVDEKLRKLEERIRELQVLSLETAMANAQRMETMRKEMADSVAALAARKAVEKKPEKKVEAKKQKPEPADRKAEDKAHDIEPGAGREKGKEKEKPKPVAVSADDLYNSAFRSFLKGDFAQAGAEFAEYAKRYPNTDLTDNSLYWMGESLANEGKPQEAVDAFLQTARRYPKSTKAPTALWRAAEIQEKMGNKEEVRAILAKIHDNYPASFEGALADEKLNAMEGLHD